MRWVTIVLPDRGGPGVGVVEGDCVRVLDDKVQLIDLIGSSDVLEEAAKRAYDKPRIVVPLSEVQLLSPILRPPSIRDFYSFEQHVTACRKAMGQKMEPVWYEIPVFYFSNPAAVLGHDAEVAIPPGCRQFDFELEVAAVLGRGGSNLSPKDAESCIAGFVVMNDWSARDIQKKEMQLSLGPAKGKDFATSLGPCLVTKDELEPYRKGRSFDLEMRARVNGKEYSKGSLADIYWSFGEMIAYASRGTEVVRGDVIGTGTVGTGCILELSLVYGSERYPWLVSRDVVELRVEPLGTLRNRIVEGARLIPLRD